MQANPFACHLGPSFRGHADISISIGINDNSNNNHDPDIGATSVTSIRVALRLNRWPYVRTSGGGGAPLTNELGAHCF